MRSSSRYGGPRLLRHAGLAVGSAGAAAAVAAFLPEGTLMFRASMATAYVGLALVAATLLIGPVNVLLSKRNPVTTDLRRDVGIWAALVTLLHVVLGLQVHLVGRPWLYFVWPFDRARLLPIRYDPWGVANHAGLAATLILMLLLTLSNDAALRRLGAVRWKSLQRWNYAGFSLVVVHGAIYQVVERRSGGWISLFVFTVALVAAGQAAGWRRVRRTRERAVSQSLASTDR